MVTDKQEHLLGITASREIKTSYNKHTSPRLLSLQLDFTLASAQQIVEWAMSERIIAFQRVLRSLPNKNAFDAFHDSQQPLEIFAIEASVKLENHTDKQELYKKILEK